MTQLTWDRVGERFYETGCDRGVLYLPDSAGAYVNGVAWNGLTNVTESPTGAEANAQYADNIKYLNLYSAEEFGANIEAFTYPDAFAEFDGQAELAAGVTVGQQARRVFGLSYRTRIGNDLEGDDFAYKLHLVYGCQASPSEKAYGTVNDSPEALPLSWEINTTPVAVPNLRPTALVTVESHKADPTGLAALEALLWGTGGTDPSLPLPDAVAALFSGSATEVTPVAPTFDNVDEITIPVVAGVTYFDGAEALASGAYTITEDTVITARPSLGYYFPTNVDDDWLFVFGG